MKSDVKFIFDKGNSLAQLVIFSSLIFCCCSALASPKYSELLKLRDSKGKSFICAKSGKNTFVVVRSGKQYKLVKDEVKNLKKKVASAKGSQKSKLQKSLKKLTSLLKDQEGICRSHYYPPIIPTPTVTAIPTVPVQPTSNPSLPVSLAPLSRALTRGDVQYLLDKAGLGLSDKEEYLVNLGLSQGLSALIDELMRQKEEPSGLEERILDRLDNSLGAQTSQSPSGQRASLLDLWINTNNAFNEKFALFLLSVWTVAGDVIDDETFRGAFWDYFSKLREAVVQDKALPELAVDLSRDPLMLVYLNNDLNKKGSPNENFARELMELFTLGPTNLDGVANYTETKPDGSGDIAVAARMLTGWKVKKDYMINRLVPEYDSSRHEVGPHTMFAGTPYQFSGENDSDLIRGIFAHHSGVAIYYAKEILKEYLNPNPSRELIEAFAQIISQSGFKLGQSMKVLLQSEAFFDPRFANTVPTNSLEYAAKVSRILGLFDAVNYNEAQSQVAQMGMQFNMAPSVFWYNQNSWLSATSQIERANYIALVLGDSTALAAPEPDWKPARILPSASSVTKSELISFISSRVGLSFLNQAQSSTLLDYLSRSRQYDGQYTPFTYDNSNPTHQREKGLGLYYLEFLTPEFELR